MNRHTGPGGGQHGLGRRPPWGALAENLFPLAPPSRVQPVLGAVGYLAAFVGTTALSLARQSGLAATRTVWAEDGNVFYLQAVRFSFWHTMWAPYNGYVQVVPRLLAQVAAHGPASSASETMAVAGAMTLAGVVCCVFHMSRGLVPQVPLRLGLAASIVLLPIATAELLDNLVNTPWWLFYAGFWAVLWRPRTRTGQVAAAVVAFLATASDPLAGLALGVAALRWAALRGSTENSWRQHTAALGSLVALGYQLLARIGGAGSAPSQRTTAGLWHTLAVRVGLGLVAGARGTDWINNRSQTVAVVLGACVLGAVVVLAVLARQALVFTLVALVYGLVCFVVPVWARGVSLVMAQSPTSTGSRYAAVPLLAIGSALFVIASRWPQPHARARPLTLGRVRAPRNVLPAVVLAAVLAPWWVADFRDANARTTGPQWPAQVKAAAPLCLAHPSEQFTVHIDPAPWFTDLPCSVFHR